MLIISPNNHQFSLKQEDQEQPQFTCQNTWTEESRIQGVIELN